MKYENFEKAKSIVGQIDNDQQTIEELSRDNVSVKVLVNDWTIMSVGCEHSCRNYAAKFVNDLKFYYEEKLKNLHAELETL